MNPEGDATASRISARVVAVLDYGSETLAEDVRDATAGDGVNVVRDHRLDD